MEAVFDVSFGAELTVTSYLDFLKKNNPPLLIAQPCPAIVNFIELLFPELIPYLAPADSPMLHTMKMIREFYPQYAKHRIAAISPCLAKKREFESTGMGDYNISFATLEEKIQQSGKPLSSYPAVPYDSPVPERASFSLPRRPYGNHRKGNAEAVPSIRKIEGTHAIYDYLKTLPLSLKMKKNPLIVDCLNCEKGCNGGTGTNRESTPVDILEAAISERAAAMRRKYSAANNSPTAARRLGKITKKYWKPGLYERKYKDRSSLTAWKVPDENELWKFTTVCRNSPKPISITAPPAVTAHAKAWPEPYSTGLTSRKTAITMR